MYFSLLIATALILVLIYYKFNRSRYFSIRSVPSPPTRSIIFGHLSELWSVPLLSHQLRAWTRQYGPIYGIFEGIRPLYVISDIDLIEEVFVKQFARFHRRRTTLTMRLLGKENLNVFTSNNAHQWKKQRTILNPTFSGAKLRRIVPTVETCVELFLQRLNLGTDQSGINIYEIYKRLTMDVICRCAFGIDTKVQEDFNSPNNVYFEKIEEFFAKDFERTALARFHRALNETPVASLCSFLFRVKRLLFASKSSLPASFWLLGHMNQFVEQRIEKKPEEKINDLLQLMIDAFHSDKASFSSGELFSNVFITLIAGFETSSTALAYCTYRLSMHPEIQEKLYEELVESNPSQTNIYDLLNNKLIYFDLFVREVLRMNPIAVQAVHRQCVEDTKIGSYRIDKGSLIQADVLSIHFNEQLWGPEPVDEFHPERHTSKRNPLAFMPFGAGPRLCIGMRFALLEIKLALVRLIDQYRILPVSNQSNNFTLKEEIVIAPESVVVQLVKRPRSLFSHSQS